MSNNVRYIDLGEVSPEIFSSMWEVDLVIDIAEPTLFKWKADRTLCHFWQGPYYAGSSGSIDEWNYDNTDISAVLTSSALSDIKMMRCFEAISSMVTGSVSNRILFEETTIESDPSIYDEEGFEVAYYTESPDVTNWTLIHPDKKTCFEIDEIMHTTLSSILQEKNIQMSGSGNDTYFLHPVSNTYKKCIGSLARPAPNNFGYSDFAITWNLDKDKTNRIRAVASGSGLKIKKFTIDDIGDRVSGLYEVTSSATLSGSLNRNIIESDFENRLCNSLNLSMVTGSLSSQESQSLYNRGSQRLNDTNWQYYGNNDHYTSSLLSNTIGGWF